MALIMAYDHGYQLRLDDWDRDESAFLGKYGQESVPFIFYFIEIRI